MESARPAWPLQPIGELHGAGGDEFGSGLTAAIERHNRHDLDDSADGRPRLTVESNRDRLALEVDPGEPVPSDHDTHERAATREATRGLVELAVGVVGALIVIDGFRAWRSKHA